MRPVRQTMIVAACAVALACGAGSSLGAADSAADYAREARLAQEVAPGIVVGDTVFLTTAAQPLVLAIFTEATPPAIPRSAVLVLHGLGLHPDWGLINGLRTGLAEAGMATLSVQMPVLAADAPREQYATLFAESSARIAAASAYLRARGAQRIAIVSHSMGAAMADAYLASMPSDAPAAWVPIGMGAPFGSWLLGESRSMIGSRPAMESRPTMPVLDVMADRDLPQVLASAPARAAALPGDACSRQVTIAGTDHFMESRQRELVAAIVPFLVRAFTGRC